MTLTQNKIKLEAYIGKLLNNRYLIRDLIGRGGMGLVYLAEDTAKGGIPVAVKILSLNLDSQQMSRRFAREIFISAQLGRKSKHIVRVLSYGATEDKVPFYVMEYLQGKNIKQTIKSQHLTISQVLYFCHQICLGLRCAHQGVSYKGKIIPVIHRDIKPENIFITQDAKGKIVKILDFGIAKFLTEQAGMSITESFIGSLPYCSPEHMQGCKLLDVRSDIYSLGILMFEMLTLKHPFPLKNNSWSEWYQAHHFETPSFTIVPHLEIPERLKTLVMKCLAKKIGDRPQNINEILATLENLYQPQSIQNNLDQNPALQLIPSTLLSQKACLQTKWPANKPVSLIGFPHLLHTLQGEIPTFWAMLPKQEINNFKEQISSAEFIQKINIYPMILWVTVLHNPENSLTRWLSYYLDLKDIKGKKLLQKLAETGYYHLLFFSLEAPTQCTFVTTLTLSAQQRQQLLDWLEISTQSNPAISAKQTKIILKAQYEKLKPQILQQFVSSKRHRFTLKWMNKLIPKFFRFKLG